MDTHLVTFTIGNGFLPSIPCDLPVDALGGTDIAQERGPYVEFETPRRGIIWYMCPPASLLAHDRMSRSAEVQRHVHLVTANPQAPHPVVAG
jgi:hypothetical protein